MPPETAFLAVALQRAEILTLALCLGLLVGAGPARWLRVASLSEAGGRALVRVRYKLDRAQRSARDRFYRGALVVLVALLLVYVAGQTLDRHLSHAPLFAALLLALWFGYALAPGEALRRWRNTAAESTPLEIPGIDFLFPDRHGLLRYIIRARAETFAVALVGACFWFTLGGFMLMMPYLALAAIARTFDAGWFSVAAQKLYSVADAAPRCIARALFSLAGLLTPGAHPLQAITARSWLAFMAALQGVSLGGPAPGVTQAFIGAGTARLTSAHLRRALWLELAACVWLVLLMQSPELYAILSLIL